MNQDRKPLVSADKVGALAQFVRTLRLAWRLFFDGRVPLWPKLIIPIGAAYVISPVDLIPDFILGLGQLDDIGIVILCVALFIELCPRAIVAEHRRSIAQETGSSSRSEDDVVEGSYRVMHDDDRSDR